ncbi:hypothetical protein NLJ89_g8028 [Agrocybe chaxingu]|uniref:Protein rds1 n=1 Tax=Agrocybe chaxingu TaxID=84603 RepID=A0A9W8JY56_9AGAR|nr:hypothetical protein NLJ89_g8028 [Agrocybe chaxingu]
MRTTLFSLAFISLCVASPLVSVDSRHNVDDTTILNFALTLEHLENAFYHGALAKYNAEAFKKAGFPRHTRARFAEIAAHEKTHVEFLTAALGESATKPCQYSFPHTDPKSFAALSQILEGVGTSAYTGAARFISNKDYLTAAASVLATEARHASWVSSAVNKVAGWSGAFDVPLGLNEVYTLAAPFITSCPPTNPPLPVKAFPPLIFTSKPVPGHATSVEKTPATSPATHVSFFTGLDKIFVPITNGQILVPEGLSGTVYAVATKSGEEATDDTIIAGPAVLLFERDSRGHLID